MKKNKGYTLAELLVSTAILAIIMAQVIQLISASSRIYSNATYESWLQTDASQVILQIEDLIVDATYTIYPTEDTDTGSDIITIKNWADAAHTQSIVYTIQLKMDDPENDPYGTLYYSRTDELSGMTVSDIPMADYVKAIHLDISSLTVNDTVTLSLDMQGERYTYSASKDIFNRNRIGTHKNDMPPSSVASTGDGTLNVLRCKTYNLDSIVPIEFRNLTPEWLEGDSANASLYYDLNASARTIKTNSAYSGNPSATPDSYSLLFTKEDGSTYTLGVYSEAVKVPLSDSNLLYMHTAESNKLRSYIPVTGIDIESATIQGTTMYLGSNGNWDDTHIFSSVTGDGDLPGAEYNTSSYKFRTPTVVCRVDEESNCFLYEALGKIEASGTPGYVPYAVNENQVLKVVTKLSFPNGMNKEITAYVYPAGYDGEYQEQYFSMIGLTGGHQNHSSDQRFPNLNVVVDASDYDMDTLAASADIRITNNDPDPSHGKYASRTLTNWTQTFELAERADAIVSFTPSSGITVSVDGKTVTIKGDNSITGIDANDSLDMHFEFRLHDPIRRFSVMPTLETNLVWKDVGGGNWQQVLEYKYKYDIPISGGKEITIDFGETGFSFPNSWELGSFTSYSTSGSKLIGTTNDYANGTMSITVIFDDGVSPGAAQVAVPEDDD